MSATTLPPDRAPLPPEEPRPPHLEELPKLRHGPRIFVFYSLAVGLTGVGGLVFADLLWRQQGWRPAYTVLLVLFTILFLLASLGCVHGIYGFILRRTRRGGRRITVLGDYRQQALDGATTALIIPIYNEDVRRVYEGLRSTYESLARTGEVKRFDFFILSDSTNPDRWVEEERHWFDLVQNLQALGRIFYRRRLDNEGKKSGNVRDFLSHWGQRYRYFMCLDADSIMSGETIVGLVQLMEMHPTTGLIQTAPILVNGRSAFSRMQQFANRLYGPLFTAGLNYWSQNGGNYWGHNAIIRTEPFMRYCDLPQLPGRKPFGGHILSHDFVEAALLRKENWEVWLASDLEGSYEEGPPAILESAQRDRRWCQGNLQHAMLLFARGLRGVNRLHLTLGIAGYLAGPLWFLFMLTGTYLLWSHEETGLSDVVVSAFNPFLQIGPTEHALLVFGLSMGVIFLPRILALIDLALDGRRRHAFGGMQRTLLGALGETVFSTLHAPVQMLFHTKFVLSTLFGTGITWGTQQRTADGTSWATAFRTHWSHMLLGLVWGVFIWRLDRGTFWWFVPVFSGMVLSVPLSVFTSRESWGQAARRLGFFVTPEEKLPPTELLRLHELLSPAQEESRWSIRTSGSRWSSDEDSSGLVDVVLDPYVNAIHVSLLRERTAALHPPIPLSTEAPAPGGGHGTLTVPNDPAAQALGERLLERGPAGLTGAEQLTILSDASALSWLHRQVWMRSPGDLAAAWSTAVRRYTS